MPPAAPAPEESALPAIQANPYGQPTEVRYSDFLKLVDADRVEKVTFSAGKISIIVCAPFIVVLAGVKIASIVSTTAED